MESTSTATNRIRKWKVFPGKNKFCCNGRVVTGAQLGIFYFTCVLIIVTSGLFFGVDCPYLAVRLTPAIPVIGGLLFVFVMASLIRTSWSDPGIIPRATPQEAADIERQMDTSTSNELYPPPRIREVRVNGIPIKLKYCTTCRIFRPPRAVHCSTCDNCVERFDHHCPWVGNCIGRRNYRYFYIFLVAVSLDCIFVCGCAITTLVLRSLQGSEGFLSALKQSPTSILVAVVAFFSMWSVIGLAGFHTFLAACNLTTNEDIKNAYSKSDQKNPFSHGSVCANYCDIICGPMLPSLIDRRGFVSPDSVAPTNGHQPGSAVPV